MRVNKTLLSVGLALLVVASVLPPGMVGTADAQDASTQYTVIQGSNCWTVDPFEPGDENPQYPEETIRPHAQIVDETAEFGYVPNRTWEANGATPTIESIMDYRYRDPDFDDGDGVHDEEQTQAWGPRPRYAPWLSTPYWKEPWSYGTYGLWNWSENQQSQMFFYDGPEGDSFVLQHDKLFDNNPIGSHGPYNGYHHHATRDGYMTPDPDGMPGGGSVTFTFRDLPAGEWAYMDDLYPENMNDIYYASGEFDYDEQSHTRYGTFHNNYGAEPLENYGGGTDFTAHWQWNDNRTGGGAFRGLQNLGAGESITIEPYFNNESYFWSERPWRYDEQDQVTDWIVRRKNGETIHLDMSQEVTIMQGARCANADLNANIQDPEVGEQVQLDAGGGAGEYHWDLDGDGSYERNDTGPTITHRYGENQTGETTVEVMVESSQETRSTDSTTITVQPGEPPSPDIAVRDDQGLADYHVVGEQLVFDATNTTDNGRIDWRTATWEFSDDNSTVTGERQVTHAFDENGTHEVTLTVADGAGYNATVTRSVEIDDPDTEDPEASLDVSPTEFEQNRSVTFDASDSDDNRDIADYRWDWNGDGSYQSGNATETFTPPYRDGSYNVSVRVVDGNGNTDTTSVPINVTAAQNPTIYNVTANGGLPDNAQITEGDSVELRANTTDNVGVERYEWDLDDDGNYEQTTASATHTTELEAGNHTVGIRAVDAAGHSDAFQISLSVDPGPDANLELNRTEANATQPVAFNASGSEAPSAITSYEWDFDGDGSTDSTTQNATETHRYGEGGNFTPSVTITTERDNTDEATAEIAVTDRRGLDDEDDSGSTGGSVGGGSSGGGGGGSAGPPPVVTEVEQRGANAALVDVRNGQDDELVEASLPESEAGAETGVHFRELAVDLASDDPHVAFETAASADAPESVPATPADETMAYLAVTPNYLDGGVDNATLTVEVERSALGGLAVPEDASLYRYDGSWERLNTSVVGETDGGYRLAATTDSLGTIAVGTDRTVSVTDAELSATTVTAGDPVEATATVENRGTEAKEVAVSLAFDDAVAATETVEVAGGETADVTLRADAGDPGSYRVSVGDANVSTLTVEQAPTGPADLSVTDVSLNRSSIAAGEQVGVTATVENEGGEAGSTEVTLRMFDEEIETKTVEVAGGETAEVTFDQRVDASGSYTVDVNGETAELEVTGQSQSGDDQMAPSVPGFGVGTALVALLAAALLARFRD